MLAVLDALDERPVTLRELARRTGLPLTTVHRAVGPLIEWGGLERVAGGLQPGLRLFELGQLVPQRTRLRELALPYMGDLYAATHEVVSLAVLDGTETVWIEQLAGRLAPPVPSRVGGRLPAHVTAAGKVLLAWAPGAVDALCAAGLQRHGPGPSPTPHGCARSWRRSRSAGSRSTARSRAAGCSASPRRCSVVATCPSRRWRWPSRDARAQARKRWRRPCARRRWRSAARCSQSAPFGTA